MRKFLGWIFRKENEKYQEEYKTSYIKLEREIIQLRKRYKLVQRIFTVEKRISIVGLEKNKNDEELFICERIDKDNITLKLYGYSYQGVSGNPMIIAKLHKIVSSENNSYYIEIIDILTVDKNVGNGSILMKFFLELVDRLKKDFGKSIDYISGTLSEVDKEHFDRSEHYYKKFGFEVVFNKERSSGKIKKQ